MEPWQADVSIVVPTYNRSRHLGRLLNSFDDLRGLLPREVVVVDDCSTDGTAKTLDDWKNSRHDFRAICLATKKNSGPGSARNLGMQGASGRIVAFTDDDCVVHHAWLRQLVNALDPARNVIGVGGKVFPIYRDVFSMYYTFHHILEPAPSLFYLITANCCYVRTHAVEVGGFDANIVRPGGEDVALSIKLYQRGYRFGLAEGAIVYHEYRKGFRDFYRTFRNYGSGCRSVTQEHYGGGMSA